MKKFIIIALMAAMPLVTFAQTKAFDKFENVEGIESVIVSDKMFKMLGEVKVSGNEKADKYLGMAENVEGLKVFMTKVEKHKESLRQAIAEYVKKSPLSELMSVNHEGSKVKIYALQGSKESIIKEGLIYVEGKGDMELVLLSFTGNINLNDLEGLKK
jgi:hypothetical protein